MYFEQPSPSFTAALLEITLSAVWRLGSSTRRVYVLPRPLSPPFCIVKLYLPRTPSPHCRVLAALFYVEQLFPRARLPPEIASSVALTQEVSLVDGALVATKPSRQMFILRAQ